MYRILYAPVASHGITKSFGITIKAGYVIALFVAAFAFYLTAAFHHSKASEPGPILFILQPVNVRGHYIFPGLNSAMIPINRFVLIKDKPFFFHVFDFLEK